MKQFFISLAGWIFVGAGTVFLSVTSLVVFWPLSFFFEKASGRLPHGVSRFWARMISAVLPFWDIQVRGLDKIRPGRTYIVVSNHQSLLDILVVVLSLPFHFKFIAKRELFWIPFFGWHLFLAGYIPLKRGDAESGRRCLEKARSWLVRGVSVLFFPEGTRSPDGRIHEFKAGAFKLAQETGVEILPLVIQGTREAIPKHSWVVEKKAVIHLKVLDPVPMKGRATDLESIRAGVRSIIMEEFTRLSS